MREVAILRLEPPRDDAADADIVALHADALAADGRRAVSEPTVRNRGRGEYEVVCDTVAV